MDKTEKEEGEEALEGHQAGVRLSELELLVSKDHAVMPSIEVFYTMLWCTCLLLCGVEVATSSINDKDSHQYHERSGSHFEMQVEASLQPIRINSWPECFME